MENSSEKSRVKDVLKLAMFEIDFFAKKVQEVAKRHSIHITSSMKVEDAAIIMVKEDINILPVIEKDVVIGIIIANDILRYIDTEYSKRQNFQDFWDIS